MTPRERWDALARLWRSLIARAKQHQSEIPHDTLVRFGESSRLFKDAYHSLGVVDDVLSEVDTDVLRSFAETYSGWAARLAPWVGRSELLDVPLPTYQQAAIDAGDAAVDAVKGAGAALGILAVAALIIAAKK